MTEQLSQLRPGSNADPPKTEAYIYIATERITPLRWHVKRKSLSPETIKWGLHSVAVMASLIRVPKANC